MREMPESKNELDAAIEAVQAIEEKIEAVEKHIWDTEKKLRHLREKLRRLQIVKTNCSADLFAVQQQMIQELKRKDCQTVNCSHFD